MPGLGEQTTATEQTERQVQPLLDYLATTPDAKVRYHSTDWKGNLNCGIQFDWHYHKGYIDVSMPNFVQQLLQKFNQDKSTKPQYSLYQAVPKIFGKGANDPIPNNDTAKVDKNESSEPNKWSEESCTKQEQ